MLRVGEFKALLICDVIENSILEFRLGRLLLTFVLALIIQDVFQYYFGSSDPLITAFEFA
jgi:hypothetical protein